MANFLTFDYVKGTYAGLGLENPDGGEDLIIQYRDSSVSPWQIAKAILFQSAYQEFPGIYVIQLSF